MQRSTPNPQTLGRRNIFRAQPRHIAAHGRALRRTQRLRPAHWTSKLQTRRMQTCGLLTQCHGYDF